MNTNELLAEIIACLEDIKALDIVEVDLQGESSLADYLAVGTGTSTAHVKGIHDRLHFKLKELGVYPLGVEGYDTGEWILMDYNDIIVHLFLEEVRDDYAIEDLHEKAIKRRIQ